MDSRWRGNDGRLGAIHRAPTQKTCPSQPEPLLLAVEADHVGGGDPQQDELQLP